jgi:F-type H+-transporting ATPase subunit gamma
MKMIASTKLAKAQKAMQNGKQYGVANSGMFDLLFLVYGHSNVCTTEVFQHSSPESPPKRKLFIVVSSDKGLCGGIHSSVSKFTRQVLKDTEHPVEETSPVMVIGDKSKAQLSRAIPQNIALSFNQIGRDIPTFSDAAGVADLVLKSKAEYDSIAIVYNRFVSALSYEPAVVEVANEGSLKESRAFYFDGCCRVLMGVCV